MNTSFNMLRRGFTLIELLVVISIISMLSSVVLVSLQSARDKGRIGAILTFEGTMYRAWASDAVAIFDFNDSAITSSPSSFSLTNTAGNYNGAVSCGNAEVREASSISGGELSALGRVLLSNPASTCNNTSFNFTTAKLDATNGSVAFWIYPTSFGTDNFVAHIASMWVSLTSSGQVKFENAITSTKSLPLNKWSHVLISWSASATDKLVIYIDGKRDIGNTASVTFNTSNLYISGFPNASFRGYMDRFAIYTHSIQNP